DTGGGVGRARPTGGAGHGPPMTYTAGGKRQLIAWLTDSINGLDPANGRVYWTQRYPADRPPQRPAPSIATPRLLDDLLFVTSYYHGPMMLKLAADKPAAAVLWRGPRSTPGRPRRRPRR